MHFSSKQHSLLYFFFSTRANAHIFQTVRLNTRADSPFFFFHHPSTRALLVTSTTNIFPRHHHLQLPSSSFTRPSTSTTQPWTTPNFSQLIQDALTPVTTSTTLLLFKPHHHQHENNPFIFRTSSSSTTKIFYTASSNQFKSNTAVRQQRSCHQTLFQTEQAHSTAAGRNHRTVDSNQPSV